METQEHCQKCRQKAYFEGFCERCFCEVIEKRVRKHVRLSALIKKNDVLVVEHPLVAYFIKSIVQDMPVTILKPMPDETGDGKTTKQVLAWTMDNELDAFLDQIFAGKDLVVEAQKEHEQNTQQIKLLVTLTDKEAEMFAQAKQIEPLPKKTRKYEALLQQLEQKHQETRYSLMKSVEELKRILNKNHNKKDS